MDEDIRGIASLQGHFGSESTVRHAEALLGQIIELFGDAEGVSNTHKNRTGLQDGRLAVYNPQTDLDPTSAKLHDKIRQLALDRQSWTGVRQKAKWALYQQKQFRRLIEDVTELVDSLVELFPAAQQAQCELCDTEVSAIGANEGISMLREIAAAQDTFLEQAITKSADGAARSHHIVFSGRGNTGFQLGRNSGNMSGFTFGQSS